MYSHGGLFEGGGGFSLACGWAGFSTAWQLEIDTYCQSVLANHWPDATRYGNIFDYDSLPYVDLITAGFPCQPFSSAGKGLGSKDHRYLVPEMMRIIEEVQPRAVLLENVPRFATLNNGDEFKRLLRAFADIRYDAEWGRIRASDVGAPHTRARWFLVAYPNSKRGLQPQRSIGEFRGRVSDSSQALGKSNGKYGNNGGLNPSVISQHREADLCRCERGSTQSRLGGDINGLSSWLDGYNHRWPAGQGAKQYDWEPSRVASDVPNVSARRKIIGNAVVPQVVYPIARTIFEWLQAQDALSSEMQKIG